MLKSLLFTATLLFPIVMAAQTAKVQALTPFEAAEAKSLYQQKSDLDKRITNFRDSLVKEYIETKDPKQAAGSSYAWFSSSGSGVFYYRAGWNNDSFLFSDDFKYIVPAPTPVQSSSYCWTQNGCSFATPAVGTIQGLTTVPYSGSIFTNN
jgi:hypothetical protein